MDYLIYLPNLFTVWVRNLFCSLWAETFGFATAVSCPLTYVGPHDDPIHLTYLFLTYPWDTPFFALDTWNIYVSTFCVIFFLFFLTFSPFQTLLVHPFLHLHLLLASYLIGFFFFFFFFFFFEFVFFRNHSLSCFLSFSSSILSSDFD
jgi:hypothetical protein